MKYKLDKYLPHLEVLKSSKPKLSKAIINNADPNFIKGLVEGLMNILHGRTKLSDQKLKQLKHYKNYLRNIDKQCCSKKEPIKIKHKKARKLLVQKGGVFPFLIPLLAPIIAKAALGGAVAATTGVVTKKILGQ